jgi:carbon storage regulator CsrA
MLVLAREWEEKLYLTTEDGTAIVITLVTINGKRARLGISAPQSVNIARGELLTERQRAELDAKANT